VLVSDDLSMGALGGGLAERTRQALAAGCDLALHCTGVLGEMEAVAEVAGSISTETAARLARGERVRRAAAGRGFDRGDAERRFDALLAGSPVTVNPVAASPAALAT
jgi:beta-N-acetylhexosaminidase